MGHVALAGLLGNDIVWDAAGTATPRSGSRSQGFESLLPGLLCGWVPTVLIELVLQWSYKCCLTIYLN